MVLIVFILDFESIKAPDHNKHKHFYLQNGIINIMNDQQRTASEAAAQQLAETSGVPYLDVRDLTSFPNLGKLITHEQLLSYRVAPLVYGPETQAIEFGVTAATDRTKLPELVNMMNGHQVTFKTISDAGYQDVINRLYMASFQQELDGDFASFGPRLASTAPKAAFQLIAQLAHLLRASDIHIEPQSDVARIRFRIDGTLHPITDVNLESYKVFLADLQTRANIKWGSDDPQSGRISFDLVDSKGNQQSVNMRIETIPSFHGEEIVVRIFGMDASFLKIDNRGFSAEQLAKLQEVIHRPNGMVLAVGPTGSGKTSMLYSIVNELNNDETKIITLEDPVEYDLPGVTQIPIHSEDKELFAEKLRAVLREDPNVIMIGEIRDLDTAKTALQASLTGHLVLSTFHASSAATAISRLLDMAKENALLASSIKIINAQRLLRKVCEHCKKPIELDSVTKERISKALSNLPAEVQAEFASPQLFKGEGCPACNGLGYRDRIAVVEQLVMNKELEDMLSSNAQVTADQVEEVAVKAGMVTLLQDGLIKTLHGLTTLEEVEHVLEF
jgi:type II secretory ATPase GspE/PulE/Tfp pilus assembly ATPase PilB-like protein